MIAIETRYLPPTNTRGARIKAWTFGRVRLSVTVPYDHSLSGVAVHHAAVVALVERHRLPWDISDMRWGGTDRGYVFCFGKSVVPAAGACE